MIQHWYCEIDLQFATLGSVLSISTVTYYNHCDSLLKLGDKYELESVKSFVGKLQVGTFYRRGMLELEPQLK